MSARNYLKVLAICCSAFVFYHANRVLPSPLLPLIKSDLALSYSQLALVVVGYDLGYGATIVLGGWLADRMGLSRTIMVGLFYSAVVLLLMSFASSFTVLFSLRVLAGFAFSTYFGPGVSLIFAKTPKENLTTALGVHSSASSLGRLVGPLVSGLLASLWGWQNVFRTVSAFPALVGLAFAVILSGREEPRGKEEKPASGLKEVITQATFIRLCAIYTVSLIFFLGTMAFLPLYLSEIYRLPVRTVGILVGSVAGVSLLANPAMGFLADRYGEKRIGTMVLAGGCLVNLALVLYTSWVWLLLVLILYGVTLSSPLLIYLSHLSRIMPSRGSATIVSIFNGVGIASGAIAGVALGGLADRLGIQAVFYALLAITSINVILARKV